MLPAPTAPSEGSAGVRNLVDRALQPTYPLSILAHQLRRRFRSNRSLVRSQTDLPDCAARGFAGPSIRPACLEPKLAAKTVRLSAALLGSTTLAFRFASRRSEDHFEAASRWRKIDSSGASSRLAPPPLRRALALPAGGDRTFGHLPHLLAVADLLVRPGPPSRSHEHHAPRSRVGEAKNKVRSLWITWISGTTIGTFLKSAVRLPIRSPCPTSRKCLNPLH